MSDHGHTDVDADKAAAATAERERQMGELERDALKQLVFREAKFFGRTTLAFIASAPVVIGLFLSLMALLTHKWAATDLPLVKPASPLASTIEAAQGIPWWVDLSPSGGNCTCNTTHVSYCREISDAFEVTSYLNIVLYGVELVLALVFVWETARYGLYGGSHAFTRFVTVVLVFVLGGQVVSAFSWLMTYAFDHCADPSFADQDATLGWPLYVRCLEVLATLGFIGYSLSVFEKTSRGPQSIPLLAAIAMSLVTAATSFSQNWMKFKGDWHSTWASCECSNECSDAAGALTASQACGWLSVIFALVTVFFMSLRAVDSHGTTLKYCSVTSLLTLIFQAAHVGAFYSAANNSSCAGSSDLTYHWPALLAVLSIAFHFIFLVLNTLFWLPACCFGDATNEDGSTKSFYQYLWWDELKDARTLAHEAREAEELKEMYEETFANEEDDMAPPVKQ